MPVQSDLSTNDICEDIRKTFKNFVKGDNGYAYETLIALLCDKDNTDADCSRVVLHYLDIFDKMIGIATCDNETILPSFIDMGDTTIDIARHLFGFELDQKALVANFIFSKENIGNNPEVCFGYLQDDDNKGVYRNVKYIVAQLLATVRYRKELLPPMENIQKAIVVRPDIRKPTTEQSHILLRFHRIEGAVRALGRMLTEHVRYHVALKYDANDMEVLNCKNDRGVILRDVISLTMGNSLHIDTKDAIQRLIKYVIDQADQLGYRRYRDGVYKPGRVELTPDDDAHSSQHRASRRRLSDDQETADETNTRSVYSCAWIWHQSLQEFLYSICHHQNSVIHWELLNSEGSSAYMRRIIEYFTENLSDDRFPVLDMERMRHCFSFMDGVYDAVNHKFHPFDENKIRYYHERHANNSALCRLVSDKPPDHTRIASCKLFKQNLMMGSYADHTQRCMSNGCPLLPEWGPDADTPQLCVSCHTDLGHSDLVRCTKTSDTTLRKWDFWDEGFPELYDWKRVPAPAIQRIFDSQQFEGDFTTGDTDDRKAKLKGHELVCQTLFMMLGRLLYPLNVYDRWQVVLFIKGTAGSGKSCIGQAVQRWFCPSDVGIMSNNVQPQFALADLYNKFINICYEIKSDFKLNQADFQSMVSGEDLGVNRKNKSVVMVQPWTATTLIIGNESGNWIDSSGSIQRRIFTVLFDKTPTSPDPNLSVDLEDQAGLLMLKCNMVYRHFVSQWGKNIDLWTKAPLYFRRQQSALKTQTDPIALFLHQIEEGSVSNLKKDPSMYMLFDDFVRDLKAFCDHRSIKIRPATAETCASAFKSSGIRTQNATKDYKGTRVDGKYVIGIGDPNQVIDASMNDM